MSEKNSTPVGQIVVGLLMAGGLFVLAYFCFAYPDAMAGTEIRGRRALLKAAIVWAWGWPLGIVGALGGGLVLLGTFSSDEDEED